MPAVFLLRVGGDSSQRFLSEIPHRGTAERAGGWAVSGVRPAHAHRHQSAGGHRSPFPGPAETPAPKKRRGTKEMMQPLSNTTCMPSLWFRSHARTAQCGCGGSTSRASACSVMMAAEPKRWHVGRLDSGWVISLKEAEAAAADQHRARPPAPRDVRREGQRFGLPGLAGAVAPRD